MNSKPKRPTITSTIGLWSLRLGTRFCCPLRIKDSLDPTNYFSILLDHLRSWLWWDMFYTSFIWLGRSRVFTMSFPWVCCIHTCLVGYNRLPPILLLQVTTRNKIKRNVFHKNTRVRKVYQVRWRGYDGTENSWLGEECLVNALDHLLTYQLRHGI